LGDYVLKGHGHETILSLFDLSWLRKGHLYTFRNVLDFRTKSRSRSPRIVYKGIAASRIEYIVGCELNLSFTRRVSDSRYRLLGESVTPRIAYCGEYITPWIIYVLQSVRDSMYSVLGESVTPHIIYCGELMTPCIVYSMSQ
jgi:hypothetical protein